MQNDDLLLEQVQDLKLKNEGFKKVVGRLQQTNKELSAGWVAMEKERDELKAINRELAEALDGLYKKVDLKKLNIKKDFSLIAAHAQAGTALHKYNSTNQ